MTRNGIKIKDNYGDIELELNKNPVNLASTDICTDSNSKSSSGISGQISGISLDSEYTADSKRKEPDGDESATAAAALEAGGTNGKVDHTNNVTEMTSSKCGITGDYVYRMKALLAVSVASTLFQILANVTQLPGAQGDTNGPIFRLIQTLNIIGYDGVGIFLICCFIV